MRRPWAGGRGRARLSPPRRTGSKSRPVPRRPRRGGPTPGPTHGDRPRRAPAWGPAHPRGMARAGPDRSGGAVGRGGAGSWPRASAPGSGRVAWRPPPSRPRLSGRAGRHGPARGLLDLGRVGPGVDRLLLGGGVDLGGQPRRPAAPSPSVTCSGREAPIGAEVTSPSRGTPAIAIRASVWPRRPAIASSRRMLPIARPDGIAGSGDLSLAAREPSGMPPRCFGVTIPLRQRAEGDRAAAALGQGLAQAVALRPAVEQAVARPGGSGRACRDPRGSPRPGACARGCGI